jgi:hypothetical protein
MKVSALFLSSFLVGSVFGHGYVQQMIIGGKTYNGPSPFGKIKSASPIRQITSTNPVTNLNSGDLTCGLGAKVGSASIVAPATAGSSITYKWTENGRGSWQHKTGPIMTYMAKCPSTGCINWNPKDAAWFKISETGLKPGSTTWFMEDIENGKSYTTKIPANIPNGDYIIRHELLALHFATKMNQAQFYPSCSQVRVIGGTSFSSLAAATNTGSAKFPGTYKSNDKGIYVPKVYTSKTYSFPGPAVAVFNKAGGGTKSTTIGNIHIVTSATPTSSKQPTTTPKSCHKKKRAVLAREPVDPRDIYMSAAAALE